MACEVICCEDNDILDIIVYGTIDVKHDDNTNNNSNKCSNKYKQQQQQYHEYYQNDEYQYVSKQ